MHWTLPQVREMDEEEFYELIRWANERADRDGEGSINVDELIDSKMKKDADDGSV